MATAVAPLAVLALLVAGCDAAQPPADRAAARTVLAWGACPGQVTIQVTARSRCGVLTVPVDHTDPRGETLALDVVQVWPPGDGGGVAASVGFNFGEPAHEPGLMALLAERLGDSVVAVAPRGVGAAGGTDLDCPETDGIRAAVAAEPDRAGRNRFLAAVGACRTRLVGQGVDLTAFGTDDLVADLEALRAAMAVERWDALVSYGEMARVSDGYVAAHATRVGVVVKDSPAPADPFAAGADGTQSALTALFDECREDPRCAQRYPDLEAAWANALGRAAARPLVGTGPTGEVRVDAPKLLRAVRGMLGGDGPAHVPDLPRVITTAADGEVHPTLAGVVAADPDHCNGYRPICTKPGFGLGAYLSQVCPAVDPARVVPGLAPVAAEVFGDHPYAAACLLWGVPAAQPPPASSAVPTLVLTGHLDAYSRPEWFEGAVPVRGATHDVAGGSRCVLEVRTAWLADPTRAPDTTPCASEPFPAWD